MMFFRRLFNAILCLTILICGMTGCVKDNSEKDALSTYYNTYDTYVFFGVDSRANGDEWKNDNDNTGTEGAPSSDVIMIISVNKESEEVKIVSVYRDTLLDIAGDGSDFEKCNSAYRNGGAYGAIDMLERNLDLQIDGYVSANFMTVADAIDALGGVEVDVEDAETYKEVQENKNLNTLVDTANSYIDEMNRIYHRETPHIKGPGKQTLSGLQAVGYSRVRYTTGSDRKRTERQRNIVYLMADSMKNADPATQQEALKVMYKEADTDLAEDELLSIFDAIMGSDIESMKGFPFEQTDIETEEKGVLLVPCDLVTNVSELHLTLYDDEDYTPNKTVEKYDRAIKSETGLTAEDAK